MIGNNKILSNKIVKKKIFKITLGLKIFCRFSNTERHKIILLLVKRRLGSLKEYKKTFSCNGIKKRKI